MGVDRLERVNALMRRTLGESLFRVFAGEDFDPGCLTITEVTVARNLRNATVRVSVLGHTSEYGSILHRLNAKAPELQRMINAQMTLKYTPRLRFELDTSVLKGDHVLGVLEHMEEAGELPPPEHPDKED